MSPEEASTFVYSEAERATIAAMRGSLREPPIPPGGGMKAAMRVLDALCRWYAAHPEEDAGLALALDHAQRVLRPGSRLVVLAEPASVLAVAASRWAAIASACA